MPKKRLATNNSAADDLNFAEEEQETTPQMENPQEQNPQEQNSKEQNPQGQTTQQTSTSDDDLNFDDLELEETQEATPATKPVEKPSKDLDITALEKEAEEQVKKQSEAKKSAEPLDEIDLEFEKELMGLKPEKSEKPQTTSSAEQNLSSQSSMQAKSAADELFSDLDSAKQTQNSAPLNQPINQSINSPTSQMNSWLEKAPTQDSQTKMIYDSTVMQTNESLKKLIDAKKLVAGISSFSQSTALQDLAIQLMEPKLEKWLNDNLPQVVEKIVNEEIKKIIPKD
jgi:cell pole-organizing protein PopZ